MINDKNCEDIGLEAPSGFSLSELPVSGHPNQRNVTKSSLDKDKSKMVGLEKLPVKRTRSISAQNPSSFPTSPTTPSVQHVVVQSLVAEAPAPILIIKSTPPPS